MSKNGIRMFGQEWSPEEKPKAAIALIHGLGEHSGRYAHVAEVLTASGYSLTAFDLQGHGKSGGIRGHAPSYDVLVEDVTQNLNLAREHFPGVPVFLYGHSLGGNLCLYYCLSNNGLKGAIATSPIFETATPPPPVKLAIGKMLYNLIPTLTMDSGLDRQGLARDPEVAKKYSSDALVHGKISARLALDMLTSGKLLLEKASDFSIPMLVMQGSADRIVSPRATRMFAQTTSLSKITYKEWDGFYHELHNEPEKLEVLKFMVDWLNQEMK
jgi:acylglycerol lipase